MRRLALVAAVWLFGLALTLSACAPYNGLLSAPSSTAIASPNIGGGGSGGGGGAGGGM